MSYNGTLTELEQTKMVNFSLRHTLIQQQLQQVMAERTAYIKRIEEAHPGHRWDEQRGLVPINGADPQPELPTTRDATPQ